MKQREAIVLSILLVATAVTLFTSIEHHQHIATIYGPIANIFVPLIAISSFLLGTVISILFQWGINIIQFEKIVKLLPNPEKTVMEALFAKRRVTQAELASQTGLSRIRVSRIIARLEEKGVINKKPLENTNMIESKLYLKHPTTQVLTRLPGLSEERMAIVIGIVFLFGLSISVLNSFHVLVLEHPLEPSLYLLAIEFFALGGLANLLLRKRIASAQFERILGILPEDEKSVLRLVYERKAITQNELVERTGAYKMKVSRILEKFQQRGIIDKKPQGYSNMIISKI